MSDKETVLELVKRLPSDVSVREILREIEFVAAVKEGLDEIDQGQGISIESVEQMLAVWTTPSSGRMFAKACVPEELPDSVTQSSEAA